MLEHAPHPLGRRYVAVSLHVAHQNGEDEVVNAAKAWLDNLFLPSSFVYLYFSLRLPAPVYQPDGSVLVISKAIKTEPAIGQAPTLETTLQHIESASRADQRGLRNFFNASLPYEILCTSAVESLCDRTTILFSQSGLKPV
jgi:hypothetical protein